VPTSRKATTEQLLCCENHRAVPDGGSGDREGGQVVVSGAWTRSMDDVNFFVAYPAQTTEDGAVTSR